MSKLQVTTVCMYANTRGTIIYCIVSFFMSNLVSKGEVSGYLIATILLYRERDFKLLDRLLEFGI